MVRRSAPEEGRLHAPLLKGLAQVSLSQGQIATAEPLLRQTLRLERTAMGQEHPDFAVSLHLLAGLCATTGREAEAVTLLEQLAALDDALLPSLLALHSGKSRASCGQGLNIRYETYLSLVARRLADTPEAAGKVFDVVLRRKSLWVELLSACRKTVMEAKHPAQAERLTQLYWLRRQALVRRRNGPGAEGQVTHQRLLEDWETRAESLEAELAERVPELAVGRRLRTADRRTVAAALPEGSVLVEFVRSPDWDFRTLFTQAEAPRPPARYLAFVLPAGRPDAVRLIDLGSAEIIDRLVTDYRRVLTSVAGPERTAALRVQGSALRSVVFDRLIPALDGCQRLVLAPDSELHRVPFNLLPTEDGGYLIDRYTISQVYTGRDLLRTVPAEGEAGAAVVIGAADFGPVTPQRHDAVEPLQQSGRKLWSRLWTAVLRLIKLGFYQSDRVPNQCPSAVARLRFTALPGTRGGRANRQGARRARLGGRRGGEVAVGGVRCAARSASGDARFRRGRGGERNRPPEGDGTGNGETGGVGESVEPNRPGPGEREPGRLGRTVDGVGCHRHRTGADRGGRAVRKPAGGGTGGRGGRGGLAAGLRGGRGAGSGDGVVAGAGRGPEGVARGVLPEVSGGAVEQGCALCCPIAFADNAR